MKKIHDLKTIVNDNITIKYFYTREKNNINGNPRFRVYIIDPDGGAVYEKIFCTYHLETSIKNFIEKEIERD